LRERIMTVNVSQNVFRLSVRQYHEMIGAGVFTDDDRVELIEGVLVRKMTKGPPHEFAVSVLKDMLTPLVGSEWVVRAQSAITLRDSEPEPDIAIVAAPHERYRRRHPGPRDVALVIEVAESSLEFDRTDKLRIYAGAGLAVYWIVNLVDDQVEVYTEPRGGKSPTYRKHAVFGPDDVVALADLFSLRLSKVFPTRD
jgi:Uma2 family endonuclease